MSRLSKGVKHVVKQVKSHPLTAIGGALMGPAGAITGFVGDKLLAPGKPGDGAAPFDPNSPNALDELAKQEQQRRHDLGIQQQGQINSFADEEIKRAGDYRKTLAQSLMDTGTKTFNSMNPGILEDLNRRGLFTSQTARDQEQGRLLGDITNEQNQQLTNFDTNVFGQIGDLRGQGLSSLLGGDQSGLDSALADRKAAIERNFNVSDTLQAQKFAEDLAAKQGRNQLWQSVIGLGGQLGSAALGVPPTSLASKTNSSQPTYKKNPNGTYSLV